MNGYPPTHPSRHLHYHDRDCVVYFRTMETQSRSLAKAISYRVVGSTSTALIVFIFSGNLTWSVGAGALDGIVKVALYFVHERLWARIDYGRPKPPEYEI